jgi:hypothetical protein
VVNSLVNGVGDEGAIKSAMASTLAAQATLQHAAQMARDHQQALSRLSPRVKAALGENTEEAIPTPVPALGLGLKAGEPVLVTTKGG